MTSLGSTFLSHVFPHIAYPGPKGFLASFIFSLFTATLKTITNEHATKKLSNLWTQNHRRTYNDCLILRNVKTWKGETKKVLGFSWRDVPITAMQTAFVWPFCIRIEGKTRHKKIFHIHFFFTYSYWCFHYRNIGSHFSRNIWLPTVTRAFSAEIVNVGQHYSIVVHRKVGIDKVSFQILVD